MAYLLCIQLQIAGLSASKFSCLFKLVTSAPPPEMKKSMVIVSGKGHFFSTRTSKSTALCALLLEGAPTVGILYCYSVFQ